ncbi:hypothetical protein PU560_08490 [Georgenia sp. 10Sc9-8]|uniref:Tail assembly chaperone n=1 Tax=Georgenia halotolerans TaxID=3028317 RepID=A0ABT5TXW7_9MICO|nr:hypothetical protein [Georgenia halotolerans]
MSTADYVLTVNNGTRRVHRAACKRATNPNVLAELDPRHLEGATPASCCKPSAKSVEEAIRDVLEPATEGMYAVAPDDTEQSAEVEQSSDGLAVLPYASTDIAKHYWPVLCKGGALALADAYGVQVKATTAEARLVGSPDDVAAAADALQALWTEVYAAFNAWRKADAEYLAIKAADKGKPWGKSGKKDAELGYLASAVQDAAGAVTR